MLFGRNSRSNSASTRRSEASIKSLSKRRLFAFKLFTIAFSCAITLLGGEVLIRMIDGYRIGSFILAPTSNPGARPLGRSNDLFNLAARYAAESSLASTLKPEWLHDHVPRAPRAPPSPEMRKRYLAADRPSREAIYAFNLAYASTRVCQERYLLDPWLGTKIPNRFVFEPLPDSSRQYRYRLPAGQTSPDGYVVNRWGFRGPDIALNRAEGTIRIAFVGASTTINAAEFKHSYPDYVVWWLNRWAAAQQVDVRFEMINAGRLGFRSDEIAAVVKHDVLPFDPDLVVYYEGSNQFRPDRYVKYPSGKKPRPPRFSMPLESWIERRSAIARRLVNLGWHGAAPEPEKRMGTVEWPAEVDEFNPDLSKRDLFPSRLGQILDDLDYIREAVEGTGSEFVLTTFTWMVHDGMVLTLPDDKNLYRYLNVTFYPFTYAHMRRHADFQNRVYSTYAREHGVYLLDVDAAFPKEPRLFNDAIHMREDGVRLRAWLMTALLLPMIEERLADGRLPRPPRREPLLEHPVLSKPPRLVALDDLRTDCD